MLESTRTAQKVWCFPNSCVVEPDVSLDLEFDPYHKWLGIPPQHQPPDSYRLLGLEVFEADRDVIRAAAERQTAHIHKYKIGPQSEHSQRLLNEIARARVCLLDPASKAEYDRTLRLTANHRRTPDIAAPPVAPPPVAPPPIPLAANPQLPADPSPKPDASNDSQSIDPASGPAEFAIRRRKPHRRNRPSAWGPAIGVLVAGAIVVGIVILMAWLESQRERTKEAKTGRINCPPADLVA